MAYGTEAPALQRAPTDYKGAFLFVGLESGEYNVTAYKSDHDIDIRQVVLATSLDDPSIGIAANRRK